LPFDPDTLPKATNDFCSFTVKRARILDTAPDHWNSFGIDLKSAEVELSCNCSDQRNGVHRNHLLELFQQQYESAKHFSFEKDSVEQYRLPENFAGTVPFSEQLAGTVSRKVTESHSSDRGKVKSKEMCSSVPVLRLLAFLFLLVAFLACIVGFFSPFWIEYHPSKASSSLSAASSSSSSSAPSSPQPSDVNSATPGSPATLSTLTFTASWQTIHVPPSKMRNNTVKGEDAPPGEASEQRASDGREDDAARAEGEAANVTSGAIRRMFEGLWARCDENLVCRCFAQNNFQMEKEFPGDTLTASVVVVVVIIIIIIIIIIVIIIILISFIYFYPRYQGI